MKIIDRISEDRVNISFEVFPPKTDDTYDKVINAVDEIAEKSGLKFINLLINCSSQSMTTNSCIEFQTNYLDNFHINKHR